MDAGGEKFFLEKIQLIFHFAGTKKKKIIIKWCYAIIVM